jgi:hypothetical protein
MHYLYGILIATAAIIAAEIVFDYSMGDYLKDLFLKEEKKREAQFARAEFRYKAALAKVRKGLHAL